ncbi:hypothetical protein ckin28_00470 [Helicobacter pylori]
MKKNAVKSIRQLEMYQNQFNEVFERYFHGTIKFFNESFDELERALCAGDADLAIAVNNKIQEGMGQELLFDNLTISKSVGNLSLAVKRVGISSLAVEKQKFIRRSQWIKIEMIMRLWLM